MSIILILQVVCVLDPSRKLEVYIKRRNIEKQALEKAAINPKCKDPKWMSDLNNQFSE